MWGAKGGQEELSWVGGAKGSQGEPGGIREIPVGTRGSPGVSEGAEGG